MSRANVPTITASKKVGWRISTTSTTLKRIDAFDDEFYDI